VCVCVCVCVCLRVCVFAGVGVAKIESLKVSFREKTQSKVDSVEDLSPSGGGDTKVRPSGRSQSQRRGPGVSVPDPTGEINKLIM